MKTHKAIRQPCTAWSLDKAACSQVDAGLPKAHGNVDVLTVAMAKAAVAVAVAVRRRQKKRATGTALVAVTCVCPCFEPAN